MYKPNLVICQDAIPPPSMDKESYKLHQLYLHGLHQNIKFKITDITRKLVSNLPDYLIDLIEIASYVYCADQAISRGGPVFRSHGRDWYRHIRMVIPVRDLSRWNDENVKNNLISMLHFLSDDYWELIFTSYDVQPATELYFDFCQEEMGPTPEEVVLFSGGLDSLAGAIDLIYNENKRIVLVSHRSVGKTYSTQRDLVNKLRHLAKQQEYVYHIPVWVHNTGQEAKETTQRTRTFLYTALGFTVATMFGLDSQNIYENGVVSMNLPSSEQLVGSQASRSTHPKVIKDFSAFFSSLRGSQFIVRNKFEFKTKTDVIKIIKKARQSNLIGHTRSCVNVYGTTKQETHCGVCSQCISRRFGIVGAGCEKHESINKYKIDIFTTEIDKGEARTSVESFYRQALDINKMSKEAFFAKYGMEISRIITSFDFDEEQATLQIIQLYKKHAKETISVIKQKMNEFAEEILYSKIPEHSLLAMAVSSKDINEELLRVPKHCFPTPAGANWPDVIMERITLNCFRIKAKGTTEKMTMYDFGFNDKRKADLGNQNWDLLCDLAKGNGQITWESSYSRPGLQKQISRLRKALRAIFGLSSDPVLKYSKEGGYKTSFQISESEEFMKNVHADMSAKRGKSPS